MQANSPKRGGKLLQQQCELTGTAETCVMMDGQPLILRPMKTVRLSRFDVGSTGKHSDDRPDFVFKKVNFAAFDLGCLFVLQNGGSGLRIEFEDCHFANKK